MQIVCRVVLSDDDVIAAYNTVKDRIVTSSDSMSPTDLCLVRDQLKVVVEDADFICLYKLQHLIVKYRKAGKLEKKSRVVDAKTFSEVR